MKKIECPLCDDSYISHDGLIEHIEDEHSEDIPKDFTPSQYLYYMKTGKTHGSCIICKRDTGWNPTTNKYNRFCTNKKCKDKYRETFKKRMIGKYGKVTLLNDPEQQRNMLAHRRISGEYKWTDGTVKTYTGTYELEFLKVLDLVMNFSSDDVMTPSPHTYYYMYEGEKKFYIPDVYIPSLNLEIEIKQGGSNPNLKPNMVKIDKAKEKLKDAVMESQKDVNYIKIVDKKYDNFIQYLFKEKDKYIKGKNIDLGQIITEAMSDINMLSTDDLSPVIEASDTNVSTEKLYPVYIVLFSNDTEFGKIIRKTTGSDYSHATISLDPSLNNMYSFSDIPYSKSKFRSDGFVRESLWSPMYRKNRFFTVMVTFVNKAEKTIIEEKIKYIKDNYDKYKYNTLGLIEYYFKFKNTKNHDEKRKMKWFCSEFVAGMLSSANIPGFDNVLMSPQDIRDKSTYSNVIILKDNYTIDTFSETELTTLTKRAEKEFRNNQVIKESVEYIDYEFVDEGFSFKSLIPFKQKEYTEHILASYTSFIDWRQLYIEFKKIYKKTDENVRFDLFELIIRNYIMPLQKSTSNVTDEIISEMYRIYNKINSSVIDTIDVVKSRIVCIIHNARIIINYPDFKVINKE